MSQFSYPPADNQLVDHIINELKSKGMFDAFRKECIADVDTKPAYQNLRLRVEGTVSAFLKRQTWKPDLNKNQLRETLRKHIYETNFLEQGVERIVDQVVNPKIASVLTPQVEDLVYSYLGLQKPKSSTSDVPTTSKDETGPLPEDLENVSLDSVRCNDEVIEVKEDIIPQEKMDVDRTTSPGFKETTDEIIEPKMDTDADDSVFDKKEDVKEEMIITAELSNMSMDIPLPNDPPKNIPYPESSPKDIPIPDDAKDIPMPDFPPEIQDESTDFKNSDTETSIDSAIIRNVSPLTPVRNFNNENSCDARPPFADTKDDDIVEPDKITEGQIPISKFRFTIEKDSDQNIEKNSLVEMDKDDQSDLNNYSAPVYDDSSCSNNLHIDYQSDKDGATHDSKSNDIKQDVIVEIRNKEEDRKKNHKSSHSSRDPHRHGSSKHKDSKCVKHLSDKRDSTQSDRKSTRDESSHSKSRQSSHQDKSKGRNDKDKKDDRKDKIKSDKDRHSSHKSSSKDKAIHSKHSSSSNRHNSSSHTDRHKIDDKKYKSEEKKSFTRQSDKTESKSSREHSSHSSSHRPDKERSKSSSSKDKENKKGDKKDKTSTDDHYSASGRGNRTRRSTDRDSNDGNSSSSKGSTFMSNVKGSNNTTDNKSSTSKSENQSSGTDSTGQSDSAEKPHIRPETAEAKTLRPVIKLDSHLNMPLMEASMPIVGKVKKPMIAANMSEAIKLMKIRKQMAVEEERKRQEAALLLEFQNKIHSSISQVYSGISGPELEFACVGKTSEVNERIQDKQNEISPIKSPERAEVVLEKCESDEEDDYLNFVYGDPKKEIDLKYFGQQELYAAELERNVFSQFYNSLEKVGANKIFLLNCDLNHEDVFTALFEETGSMCEIVHFEKIKHTSEPSTQSMQILSQNEIILPGNNIDASSRSPCHSDSSLDMSTDYEKRIDEIISTKSRKDVMEIILGAELMSESSTNCIIATTSPKPGLKRKSSGQINDSRQENKKIDMLMPIKVHRLSLTEQISSTTKGVSSEDNGFNTKSKYLGKAHRVGLPKPKQASEVSMSPSSDKSIENYVQNSQTDESPPKVNGAITSVNQSAAKKARRTKETQRYDTSDLYKPKFSYLSKRHSRVT